MGAVAYSLKLSYCDCKEKDLVYTAKLLLPTNHFEGISIPVKTKEKHSFPAFEICDKRNHVL